MSARALLMLTALLLLCVTHLHARRPLGCKCIRTSALPMPLSTIRKIEVRPPSGYCRYTEIRITRKNGRIVCADPEKQWVKQMLLELQTQTRTQSLSINQM